MKVRKCTVINCAFFFLKKKVLFLCGVVVGKMSTTQSPVRVERKLWVNLQPDRADCTYLDYALIFSKKNVHFFLSIICCTVWGGWGDQWVGKKGEKRATVNMVGIHYTYAWK
jgi:hypothetical protein